VQTSPPDRHGFLSLGTSVDCSLTAAQCARHVVAEVNHQMPRTFGDSFLHISQVSAMVETDRPLLELPWKHPRRSRIASPRRLPRLIPDGAVLQTGIGGIPDAVLGCLKDHQAIGVHSEMCSDGVIDLSKPASSPASAKTFTAADRRRIRAGTKRLFTYMHENPLFEMHPTSYTNDPFIIRAARAHDRHQLRDPSGSHGQVCADSIGIKPYSGFGGQVDFVRGAARSKGASPSSRCHLRRRMEPISRIVPVLDPGSGVVTSRADVHYVITEYGIAYLHGKSLRQRAEA